MFHADLQWLRLLGQIFGYLPWKNGPLQSRRWKLPKPAQYLDGLLPRIIVLPPRRETLQA